MIPNDIKFIVVHCSATKPSMDVNVDDIRRWHVEERGWSDIGYHFVITRSGELEKGRELTRKGAHVKGFNHNSWGICLVGGIGDNGKSDANFTNSQYNTLNLLLTELSDRAPNAEILGHRDFEGVTKDCPCFDVRSFVK